MSANTADLAIAARTIGDSRGDPTVEVELQHAGVAVTASVPAGKTKGRDEAITVSADQAVATIRDVILPLVRDANA